MTNTNVELERALKLVERLIEISPDAGLKARAVKMRGRLLLPMERVLAKVPGASVIEKAELLGVTRQAVYGWIHGISRPRLRLARKLERMTGFSAEKIRGREPED